MNQTEVADGVEFLKTLTPEQCKNLTVDHLDKLHGLCVKARDVYDEAKAVSDHAHKELKELQAIFCTVLENLERTSYKSKHGTFSYSYRDSYKIDDKPSFFNYLKDNFGEEGFENLVSVNYQSLNSFCKELVDQTPDLVIPGIVCDTSSPIASMRKG